MTRNPSRAGTWLGRPQVCWPGGCATTHVRAGHLCPGRRIGSLMPERAGAAGTWNNRPPGCSSKCRPRWLIAWAGLSIGITARCTAGATRCHRRMERRRPHHSGGTLRRAWVSAETSSAAVVSKEPGCRRRHCPRPCCSLHPMRPVRPPHAPPLQRLTQKTHTRPGALPPDPLVHVPHHPFEGVPSEPTPTPSCVSDDAGGGLRHNAHHWRTGPGPARREGRPGGGRGLVQRMGKEGLNTRAGREDLS